jgi:hypothetical protein
MTISTAARMAFQVNNQLTENDLNENLKVVHVYSKSGKLIPGCSSTFEGSMIDSIVIADEFAIAKGYSDFTLKVEFANWYKLDWKIIPWVCPLNENSEDWSSTDSWYAFAISEGLNPEEHIKKLDSEYLSDQVSLLLWNLRINRSTTNA